MADYSELKRKAQEIRDEVKAGANTANRVGLALEETVNALEAENQRAEQAEVSLENAVQMLQDETEDLPSIRERLDTLVVNDLTTGGADKALSAKMGKVLSAELTELEEKVSELEENGGGGVIGNLTGYVALDSVSQLPTDATTLGYLIGNNLYVYVGEGGNTNNGTYKDCGEFRGPKGEQGPAGADGTQGPQGPAGATGSPGITSAEASVDETTGIPAVTATIDNKVLKLNFTGLKGAQGNSGYQGVAGELQVVNNLTEGGETAALSAEMGKQLSEQLTGDIITKDFEITEKDTDKYGYGTIEAPAGTRGLIPFDVSELEEFSLEVSVLTDSPIKLAIHRTSTLYVWSIFSADSGWIDAGKTVIKDNTFGTATDGYLRLIITNNNGTGIPDISTILQYVTFKLSAQRKTFGGGILSRLENLEAQGLEIEKEIENINRLTETSIKKFVSLELDITDGKALNSTGVQDNVLYELINYLDVSEYNGVQVTTGLWISNQQDYDTTIELYDSNKSLLHRYKARDLYGSAPSAFAFIYSGSIATDGASYIRFSNLTSTPGTNTNSNFTPTEASAIAGDMIDSDSVYDKELGKSQSKINAELKSEIFGNTDSDIIDTLTQSDLLDEEYLSTTSGGGRGYYNISIESYDRYTCTIAVASDSTVKTAIALTKISSYGDSIYDSTWIGAGKTHSVNNKTSSNPEVKYIQLRFTYINGGVGIPTVEEIKQYITIAFEGVTLADRGIKGKIEELEKVVFPDSASGYPYQGEKISFRDSGFSAKVIGNLSSGTSSRQGGAIFGNYLFQFHNTLATIVVYNLAKKENVQVLNLTANSTNHAGSGGFGNEYYDSSDPFPLLYISAMDERKVYAYRITGTEGSWSISIVQTITLDTSVYIPNIAVDIENNMLVAFGYLLNSWRDETGNASIIFSCPLPKLADGDVTISEFSHGNTIPFIYAEQGAFARFGKLYLSYGNTATQAGAFVIDYVAGVAVSHLDFSTLGNFEPEAFCKYGEDIIMTDQNGNIYRLTF